MLGLTEQNTSMHISQRVPDQSIHDLRSPPSEPKALSNRENMPSSSNSHLSQPTLMSLPYEIKSLIGNKLSSLKYIRAFESSCQEFREMAKQGAFAVPKKQNPIHKTISSLEELKALNNNSLFKSLAQQGYTFDLTLDFNQPLAPGVIPEGCKVIRENF